MDPDELDPVNHIILTEYVLNFISILIVLFYLIPIQSYECSKFITKMLLAQTVNLLMPIKRG